jgi:hypothetical protein
MSERRNWCCAAAEPKLADESFKYFQPQPLAACFGQNLQALENPHRSKTLVLATEVLASVELIVTITRSGLSERLK